MINHPIFPSRFIRAGAGAGKTSTLIKTFFEFVEHYKEQKQKLPRIIITTFTRKATQEVKERLLLQALSIDDLNNDQILFQYINKKSMVHISTIHGVLSLMLSKNHDLLGLTSDLKVSDHKSLYKIYYRELKAIFKSEPLYLELLEHYNFKDLVQLVVKFHENSDEYDLKAVDKNILIQLRQQKITAALADLVEILAHKPEVQDHKTWKGYFDFIQDFYSQLKTTPINFKNLIKTYEAKPRKPNFSADKPVFDTAVHEKIVEYFSSDSDFLDSLDSDEFIDTYQTVNQLFHQLASRFHQRITDFKMKSGQISISDLETLSLKLIREFPEAVRAFSSQYDYFMVDEYQDTSPLQVKILNALIGERPQFIVGDPQQSIYLFRGARSEVFLDKQTLAQQKQHELISLQTNYRSDHRLMHGLNAITQNFSNQFAPMIPKDREVDAVAEIQAYYIKAEDEFAGLVNHIHHLVQKGIPFSDICILFGKNADIFDFSKYALKHNIPVQSQIAAGFDQKREVVDLVSFLKFLVNPYDNLNLHILLRSPWFSMTDVEMLQIRQSNSQSFWSQLKKNKNVTAQVLTHYLSEYQRRGVMAVLEKFILDSGFLRNSLYLDPTGKREANIYKFISNLKENLRSDQFILNDYLSAQFNSFQDDLSSNLNESLALFSGNRVSVMTIHGAKGLQFKHVLLPGVCTRPKATHQMQFLLDSDAQLYSIPIMNREMKLSWSAWGKVQKKILNEKEYLEFERLFYVAITRAEKTISFIADSSKKPPSGSWCTKLDWPMVGVHHFENYSVESLDYGDNVATSLPLIKVAMTVKDKLGLQDSQKDVLDQSISVTDLISKEENAEASLPQAVKIKNEKMIDHLAKAQKGTDLHRFFESLKYLSEAQVLAKARVEERKAMKWLKTLSEVPFETILTHGHAEWGFGLQTRLGTLQGQIDLWARIDQKIYILDYKTGSSAYSEKAFSQLHLYAECLKKMQFIEKTDQVQLAVLYPFEEKALLRDLPYNLIADL